MAHRDLRWGQEDCTTSLPSTSALATAAAAGLLGRELVVSKEPMGGRGGFWLGLGSSAVAMLP